MRAETFLSMYRVLEGMLDRKYAGRENGSSSVVMRYLSDPESEPVRAQLDLCRELRNLLTHNADADGQPVAEPSKAMLDTLYKIIDYVESPKPALWYATSGERILQAHLGDPALEVMRRMDKHGFSHVPVIEKNALTGVFSMRSVFSYVLKNGGIGEDTRVRDFGELLKMDRPGGGEKFLLLPMQATYHDARAAFERASERNSRLAAVFITENGRKDEPLLGMLTPWDVLGEKATPEERDNGRQPDAYQAIPDAGRQKGR